MCLEGNASIGKLILRFLTVIHPVLQKTLERNVCLIMNIISCLELAQPRKYLSLPELILSGKNDLLVWEMVW